MGLTRERVLVVVLSATGLRIDNIRYRLWRPTVGLLLVAMPLTIAAVATLAWGHAGMTVAAALLLGAILAPTDPPFHSAKGWLRPFPKKILHPHRGGGIKLININQNCLKLDLARLCTISYS